MVDLPEGYFWDAEFQLGDESGAIAEKVWPPFLATPSDLEDADLKIEMNYADFIKRYPAWGIRSKTDGRLAAYANAVFVKMDLSGALPNGGWHEVIQVGARREIPNCLALVVANVDPDFQSLKLSYKLIERAKAAAKLHKINVLVAPVRPSHKHLHPELTIEEYVERRRADGSFEDPWLRAHERSGGEKLNICYESARVRASLARWSEWTGLTLTKSGAYPLEKGLAPLIVDTESGIGTYLEPNVWFRYPLS